MEKAIDTNIVKTSKFVRMSPDQLRIIADKMEQSAKIALPGQEIIYDITSGLSFIHDPEKSLFGAKTEALRS